MKRPSDYMRKLGWCQGSFFQDRNGEPCNVNDAESCCMSGAISLAWHAQEISSKQSQDIRRAFRRQNAKRDMATINDRVIKTKQEAIALLEKAEIEALGEVQHER